MPSPNPYHADLVIELKPLVQEQLDWRFLKVPAEYVHLLTFWFASLRIKADKELEERRSEPDQHSPLMLEDTALSSGGSGLSTWVKNRALELFPDAPIHPEEKEEFIQYVGRHSSSPIRNILDANSQPINADASRVTTPKKRISIVRDNLLKRKHYSPYCGADRCRYRWPRTTWSSIRQQFMCNCGWVSSFDEEFIKEYIKVRKSWK